MKIFDLEQQIMNCWHAVDDVDLLARNILDTEKWSNLPAKEADELFNILFGIKNVYDQRFQELWNTFEQVSREFHMYRKQAGAEREEELARLFDEALETMKASDA